MEKKYKKYVALIFFVGFLNFFLFLTSVSAYGAETNRCEDNEDYEEKLFSNYTYPLILAISEAHRSTTVNLDYLTIRCIEKKISLWLKQKLKLNEFKEEKYNELKKVFKSLSEAGIGFFVDNLECGKDVFEFKISVPEKYTKTIDITSVNDDNLIVHIAPIRSIVYRFEKNLMVLISNNELPLCVFQNKNLPSGVSFLQLINDFINNSNNESITTKRKQFNFSCKYTSSTSGVATYEAFIKK